MQAIMQSVRLRILPFLIALLLTACGGSSNFSADVATDPPPVTSGNWYRPAPFTSWQWQLQGNVNTSYDAEIYDIDLFDSPSSLIQQLQADGKKVICYFSAGSYEDWRADANLFNVADIGQTIAGFVDERWLDIRSADVRDIMQNRLDLAVQKGCDGVEPDNVDGYINNTGFNLSFDDQLAFNRFLANEAHARELSVGLKNNVDQINELVDYFDFTVNEECFEFFDCDLLEPFIEQGKAVLHVEYNQAFIADQAAADAFCLDTDNLQFSSLVLPVELDDSFRFSCF